MLNLAKGSPRQAHEQVAAEHELVSRINELLGDRRARIFPPSGRETMWQIGVLGAPPIMTVSQTLRDAIVDLGNRLEAGQPREWPKQERGMGVSR